MRHCIGGGQIGEQERKMKIGDLVIFNPKTIPGALTAVKYINRIHGEIKGTPGLILLVNENNCQVNFGGKVLVINKKFLEVL